MYRLSGHFAKFLLALIYEVDEAKPYSGNSICRGKGKLPVYRLIPYPALSPAWVVFSYRERRCLLLLSYHLCFQSLKRKSVWWSVWNMWSRSVLLWSVHSPAPSWQAIVLLWLSIELQQLRHAYLSFLSRLCFKIK